MAVEIERDPEMARVFQEVEATLDSLGIEEIDLHSGDGLWISNGSRVLLKVPDEEASQVWQLVANFDAYEDKTFWPAYWKERIRARINLWLKSSHGRPTDIGFYQNGIEYLRKGGEIRFKEHPNQVSIWRRVK